MREKIDGLKQEREVTYMQLEQLEKQVESLTDSNNQLTEQNRMLIDRVSAKLTSDYKSQRTSTADLVPLFKPLHAKTVSIIELVK